jgi:wyosine [tRNA(Phe)-imidazoG37] synthetase (radical SAM superfamily)
MDYEYVKTFEFNFNFGTLLSVDFSSCCENTDLNILTEEIFNEISDCVKDRGIPDMIWIKGMGNSIKYANSKQIIDMIKDSYPSQKVGVYLNCALFQEEELRKDFYECDLVAINLNTVSSFNFSKINKCPEFIVALDVLEGIKDFREKFKGNLGIYTMLLSGINDTEAEVEKLKRFLLEVMPDHFSVSNYTINGFKPISDKFKKYLEEAFRYVPFKVIYMF